MDVKIIPFIVSIAWELSSPVLSLCLKRAIRNELNRDIEDGGERKSCEDLIQYSSEAAQLMAGLFITLVSIGVVTYLEILWEFWFTLYAILMIFVICAFLWIITSDPYKWTARKILFWNRKILYAIGLNVVMIVILSIFR